MTSERSPARRPLHAGVLVGMSAATYAVALAGVAALQSADDQAVIEERRPTVEAIAGLARHNDALASRLDRAAADYDAIASRYDPLVGDLTRLEAEIDELSGTVARIDRSSASLPTRVAITRSVRAAPTVSRPTTHATTGASGAR